MNLWERWNSWSLILRIVGGLVVGTVLALLTPWIGALPWLSLLGTLFVSALKAIAPLLVLLLVVSALCNANKIEGMGNVILLYLASTFIAGVVAVIASFMVPLHVTLKDAAENTAPSGVAEVLNNLLTNIFSNPFSSLTEAFLTQYAGAMDDADEAIVYFSPEAIALKKLPPITAPMIEKAFGRPDLTVFDDSALLKNKLLNMKAVNTVLLMMSSGNFNGIDVNELGKKIISLRP